MDYRTVSRLTDVFPICRLYREVQIVGVAKTRGGNTRPSAQIKRKKPRFFVKRQAVWFDSRRDLNGKSSDRGLPEKGKAGGGEGGCGGMHPVT